MTRLRLWLARRLLPRGWWLSDDAAQLAFDAGVKCGETRARLQRSIEDALLATARAPVGVGSPPCLTYPPRSSRTSSSTWS